MGRSREKNPGLPPCFHVLREARAGQGRPLFYGAGLVTQLFPHQHHADAVLPLVAGNHILAAHAAL